MLKASHQSTSQLSHIPVIPHNWKTSYTAGGNLLQTNQCIKSITNDNQPEVIIGKFIHEKPEQPTCYGNLHTLG